MKKTLKILIIFIGLFLSASVFCQVDKNDSFILPKKKKKRVSKTKLQKKACLVFSDHLSAGPKAHKKIAQVQKIVLKETSSYIEGNKDGCITKLNKTELEALVKKTEDFQKKLDQFCKDCKKYNQYLRSLY